MRRPGEASLADALLRPGIPADNDEPRLRGFWTLLLASFAARVAVGLIGDQALHPDEIFQYLEPAHGTVFGSQLMSWEFIYGARSYLIPSFVAGILHAMNFAGLGQPEYYIPAVKITFCALSLLLPVSMYWIGRSMWGGCAGNLAFLFGCFWYEFVGFAHKPLSDMVSCYLVFAALALALGARDRPAKAASAALLMALAFGVRYQALSILAPLVLVLLLDLGRASRLAFLGTSILGIALVGWIDHLAWGGFFHSFLLNLEANVSTNSIRTVNLPAHHYALWLGLASLGLAWLALAYAAANHRRHLLFLVLFAVFFVLHYFPAHKEYRFVFLWLPLWLLIFAEGACALRQKEWMPRLQTASFRALACAPLAAASLLGISNSLPEQHRLYNPNFSEMPVLPYKFLHKDPRLQLYLRLGKDDSLLALMEKSIDWTYSGGYYYLHKQVPIYTPETFISTLKSAGQPAEINRWLTHIISEPTEFGRIEDEKYGLVEKNEAYALWKVKGVHRAEVHGLENYRYSGNYDWLIHNMAKYLPADANYSPQIAK